MAIPRVSINSCGLADYPPGTRFGPRLLNDYEFVWIERGRCERRAQGGTLSCPPGTVVLCQPGTEDIFDWDPGQTTRHGYVHFEFRDPVEVFLPLYRRVTGSNVLLPLLRQVVWLVGQETSWTDALANKALKQALHWFVWGFYTHDGTLTPREQPPVLTRAIAALRSRWEESMSETMTVAELADAAGVSRGHLARVCKQHLLVSPQALLRYLRLERGLLMLTRSELKVQAIAEHCGFTSPFHFSRCCKEAYGLSPREIRAAARAGSGRPPAPVPGLRRLYQQQIALS